MPHKVDIQRVWVFAAILFFAWLARLSVYDYGLPYVEHVDEPHMWALANDQRGLIDSGYRRQSLAGYPPGYIWTAARIMDIADWAHPLSVHLDMGMQVRFLRFGSVCADLITISALMATIFWLGGKWAAVLGASLWIISPPIALNVVVAQSDAWAIMFVALSAMFAVRAIISRNVWLSLFSTIMGLAATAFKYPCAPILLMPAISYLWLLRKTWRESGLALLSYVAAPLLVATVAYILLIVAGGSNLDIIEAANFRANAASFLVDPFRWGSLGLVLAWMVGLPFVFVGIGSVLALIFRRVAWRNMLITTSLFVTGLLLFAMTVMYVRNRAMTDQIFDSPPKYLLSACVLFLIVSCAVIGKAVLGKRAYLLRVLVTALSIFWLIPVGVPFITEYHHPSVYVEVQKWFEQNVPAKIHYWTGGYISYRILSRYEGGYWGFKEFYGLFGQATDNRQQMPDDLTYVMVTDLEKTFEPFQKVWMPEESMTQVKMFDNQGMFGPKIYVYSPKPLPTPQQTAFTNGSNEIVLRGLQINETGNAIKIESYWQSPKGAPQLDYSYFVHLIPAGTRSAPLAQQDQQLGKRRTSTWVDPKEILEGGTLSLSLPALPPGDYELVLGIYEWRSGTRLKLADGQTILVLRRFSIF